MNIGDVLCTNYSGKSWILTSPDDYSALEWNDSSEKPTEEQLRNELSALENAEPMRRLRFQRDALLKETDWTQGKDVPVEIQSSYVNYRKQLRDLPSIATPILDDSTAIGIRNVTWPDKPSS
tara:strand:- start:82 stop:447 length:366 start_codon:yes stop_codon:yes gene_type:complete